MNNYEEIEEEMCEFKSHTKLAMDLLVDSYKWLKLSEYTEDVESKMKYKNISDTLYNLFKEEHENIEKNFRGN